MCLQFSSARSVLSGAECRQQFRRTDPWRSQAHVLFKTNAANFRMKEGPITNVTSSHFPGPSPQIYTHPCKTMSRIWELWGGNCGVGWGGDKKKQNGSPRGLKTIRMFLGLHMFALRREENLEPSWGLKTIRMFLGLLVLKDHKQTEKQHKKMQGLKGARMVSGCKKSPRG